ncbi:MAG: hypothetical protein AB2764_11535 [Candidatus Thiodiazotropha endolucinida]
MAITREKAKNRREQGPFVPLPCSVLNHDNFKKLSSKAVKLLMDMVAQLRFKNGGTVNNGDISAAMTIMKDRGWSSKESLDYALRELMYYGFVKITRQGGRHKASLYAVTWWAIDECNGKLDVKETRKPSNEWKESKKKWRRPRRKVKLKSVPRFSREIDPYSGAITNFN